MRRRRWPGAGSASGSGPRRRASSAAAAASTAAAGGFGAARAGGRHRSAAASAGRVGRRCVGRGRVRRRVLAGRGQQQLDLGQLRADGGGHRVEDVGALVDRRLRAGELLLDAQHVAHRAGRRARSPRGSPRRRCPRPRRGPSARAPGPASRRPRATASSPPRGRSRRQLVAAVLAQLVHLRRDALLVGHDEHARSRRCARRARGRAPRPPSASTAATPSPRTRCGRAPARCSPRSPPRRRRSCRCRP